MNILFFAPGFPPCVWGGAEMLNRSVVSILSKEHNLTLVSACNISDDNYKLVYLKRIRPNRISVPLRIFAYLLLNLKKIDVVHLTYAQHNSILWAIFPLLKIFIKYNYILYIVDGGIKEKIPFGYRWCLKKANTVITPGKPISDFYENRIKRKVITIPGALHYTISNKSKSEIRKKYSYDDDDFIILYFATLELIKRPNDLLEVIRLMGIPYLQKHNIKVIFCSKGSLLEPLKKLSLDYGLTDHVEFTGFVDEISKPDYYKMADVYVHCSLTESTISITMMEAIANKLPLIITKIPQFEELISINAAISYTPKDVKMLKASIEKLIIDPNLRLALVNNITEGIKMKYLRSAEDFVNDLIKHYSY